MRILVTGFHHSGTSILRKLIGRHPDVVELTAEVKAKDILKTPRYVNMVMKSPNMSGSVYSACKHTKDLKVICIFKDPRDCYYSLKERFGAYSFKKLKRKWIECLQNALKLRRRSANCMIVRYEDLFKEGALEEIFRWVGLNFDKENILVSSPWYGPVPDPQDNIIYRAYQLSQPFVKMSSKSKLSDYELRKFDDPQIKIYMERMSYA